MELEILTRQDEPQTLEEWCRYKCQTEIIGLKKYLQSTYKQKFHIRQHLLKKVWCNGLS
jgi:hypothetical protein